MPAPESSTCASLYDTRTSLYDSQPRPRHAAMTVSFTTKRLRRRIERSHYLRTNTHCVSDISSKATIAVGYRTHEHIQTPTQPPLPPPFSLLDTSPSLPPLPLELPPYLPPSLNSLTILGDFASRLMSRTMRIACRNRSLPTGNRDIEICQR